MKIDESLLSKFNYLFSILLLILFSLAIIYNFYNSKYTTYENVKNKLQNRLIEANKDRIKDNVFIVKNLLDSKIDGINFLEDEKEKTTSKIINELNKKNLLEYVFILKLEKVDDGTYIQKVIAHPSIPYGQILNKERKDLNGKQFAKEYEEKLLKYGSTFFNYSQIHPISNLEKYKTSFFLLDKKNNWIIGSGFYINDVIDSLKTIELELEQNMNSGLQKDISVTIAFLLISIFVVILVNYFLKSSISEFKKEVSEKNEKLEASSYYLKQYSSIIERSNIVSKTDIDGNITYVSDDFCKLTGYRRDELIGKNHNILRHPDSTDDFFERLWYIIKSKQTFRSLVKNLSKDNRTMYFLTTISPILDKNGEILEFIAHRYDFTTEVELNDELIKQNEILKKSKDSLDEAQKIAKLGNWEYDFINDKMYFSNEALNIYGLNSNENGLSLNEFRKTLSLDESKEIDDLFRQSIENRVEIFFEHKVIKKDGKISIVEVTAKHDFDENGKLIKTYGVVHDITSRKEIEKELYKKDIMLLQQSKMAAMGEMISNIAHQWRQPLSAISTAATGTKLQKELGVLDEKALDDTLDMINKSVQYLSKTIDDFRYFFNPNSEKVYFKIDNSISKAVDLVKPQFITKNINIITKIEDFKYFGLENEFIQVLINLLNNARDELVKNEEERLIYIETYKDEMNYYISIKDNACGIPCDIIDRIFEPYFTTKHKSEGTGIGLYMSSEIIVKHLHGEIIAQNCSFEYENKKYEGANFVISLPIEEIK